MAEQLKPMAVNPGEPVTSELMANLVSNINIINSLSSSLLDASKDDNPNSAIPVIESGSVVVAAKMDGTGYKAVKFTKAFTSSPYVTCTLYQPDAKSFVKEKYQPVVAKVSVSGFTVKMMPVGASVGGDVEVHWIALG